MRCAKKSQVTAYVLRITIHPMSEPPIFTPSFVTLATCNFLRALCFYLLTVVMTQYSLITYSLSYSTAALSVSVFVVGALASRIFLGRYIDVWGIKRSFLASCALITVASFFYLTPLPFNFLLVVRAIDGLGFGVASGAGASGAAVLVPAQRRAEGIGYFSMTQALATGIGPFVAIWLIDTTNSYQVLFSLTVVMGIAATILCCFITLPEPNRNPQSTASNKASQAPTRPKGIHRFIQTDALSIGVTMTMVYICYAGLVSYLTLYAAQAGFSDVASIFFVVYAVAILASRPGMGRMADRHGESTAVRFTLPALAVGMGALGFAGIAKAQGGDLACSALVLLSAACCGFGIGSTQSVLQALVAKTVPPREIGLGNSTYLMTLDIGSAVGPVLLGLFVEPVGYSLVYIALAVWALAALGVFFFMQRHKTHQRTGT